MRFFGCVFGLSLVCFVLCFLFCLCFVCCVFGLFCVVFVFLFCKKNHLILHFCIIFFKNNN